MIAPALTILGGFFVLVGGAVLALFGAILGFLFRFDASFFFVGIAVGLVTIVVGVLMALVPRASKIWGALGIVLALVSIPTALAGFVVGFLLVLIGGILCFTWTRPPPAPEFRVIPPNPAPPPSPPSPPGASPPT